MQKKVSEFNKNKNCHNLKMPVSARLLDIESELGELSKEYLKCTKYGTLPFEKTEDFELEFGDTLYSLLSLANETGVDSEKALNLVIEKYKSRIKNNGTMGSK